MILPALDRGGYAHNSQGVVGVRLGGGGRHKVDVLAEKGIDKFLISLKWQQTGGTAEQKVPFEVMCLADTLNRHGHTHAYIVLGGEGWTLRNFYTSGGLNEYLKNCDKVNILTLEQFVAKANKGEL
jgi:hypothetical protein